MQPLIRSIQLNKHPTGDKRIDSVTIIDGYV